MRSKQLQQPPSEAATVMEKLKKTSKKLRNILSPPVAAVLPAAPAPGPITAAKYKKKKVEGKTTSLKIPMKAMSKATAASKTIKKTKSQKLLPLLTAAATKLLAQSCAKGNKSEADSSRDNLGANERLNNGKTGGVEMEAPNKSGSVGDVKKLPKAPRVKVPVGAVTKIARKLNLKANSKVKKKDAGSATNVLAAESAGDVINGSASKKTKVTKDAAASGKSSSASASPRKHLNGSAKHKVIITNELKNLGVVVSGKVSKLEKNSASAAATAGAAAAAAILISKDKCNPSICEMVKTKSRASVLKSRFTKGQKASAKEEAEKALVTSAIVSTAVASPATTPLKVGSKTRKSTVEKSKNKSIDKKKKKSPPKKVIDKNDNSADKIIELNSLTALPTTVISGNVNSLLDETSSQQSSLAGEPPTPPMLSAPKPAVLARKNNCDISLDSAKDKPKSNKNKKDMNRASAGSKMNNISKKVLAAKTPNSKSKSKGSDGKDEPGKVPRSSNASADLEEPEDSAEADPAAISDSQPHINSADTQSDQPKLKRKYTKKRTVPQTDGCLSKEEETGAVAPSPPESPPKKEKDGIANDTKTPAIDDTDKSPKNPAPSIKNNLKKAARGEEAGKKLLPKTDSPAKVQEMKESATPTKSSSEKLSKTEKSKHQKSSEKVPATSAAPTIITQTTTASATLSTTASTSMTTATTNMSPCSLSASPSPGSCSSTSAMGGIQLAKPKSKTLELKQTTGKNFLKNTGNKSSLRKDLKAGASKQQQKKKMISKKSDVKNRRMKLFGFWSGPKKHRVASLNASAKVHCLYENESRSTLDLAGSNAKEGPSPTSSRSEDDEQEPKKGAEAIGKNVITDCAEEMNATKRSLRIVPGLRGIGKHWEMDDSSLGSASDREFGTGNWDVTKIKKKKSVPKRAIKATKAPAKADESDYSTDEDTRATPPKAKYVKSSKRSEKPEAENDVKDVVLQKRMASLNASAMMAATYAVGDDLNSDFSDLDNKFEMSSAKSSKAATVAAASAEELKSEGVEVRPVSSSVVIMQDTDVTITGVYVDSSLGSSQEAYCKMQYRVQSSVMEERVVRPTLQQEPPKCYTPLDALSNMGRMLPPGHDKGFLPASTNSRSPMCESPVERRLYPHSLHQPGSGGSSAFCVPTQNMHDSMGYYQPAGPLISSHVLHSPQLQSLQQKSPESPLGKIPLELQPSEQPSLDNGDNDILITGGDLSQRPALPQPTYHYGPGPGLGPGLYSRPVHQMHCPTYTPQFYAPYAQHPQEICYTTPYPHYYAPKVYPTSSQYRRYVTAPYYTTGPPTASDLYDPANGEPGPNSTQLLSPGPSSGQHMEHYPGSIYYPAYSPNSGAQCYNHNIQPPYMESPYHPNNYQCPMQSCPKNVHTGPLIGNMTSKGPVTSTHLLLSSPFDTIHHPSVTAPTHPAPPSSLASLATLLPSSPSAANGSSLQCKMENSYGNNKLLVKPETQTMIPYLNHSICENNLLIDNANIIEPNIMNPVTISKESASFEGIAPAMHYTFNKKALEPEISVSPARGSTGITLPLTQAEATQPVIDEELVPRPRICKSLEWERQMKLGIQSNGLNTDLNAIDGNTIEIIEVKPENIKLEREDDEPKAVPSLLSETLMEVVKTEELDIDVDEPLKTGDLSDAVPPPPTNEIAGDDVSSTCDKNDNANICNVDADITEITDDNYVEVIPVMTMFKRKPSLLDSCKSLSSKQNSYKSLIKRTNPKTYLPALDKSKLLAASKIKRLSLKNYTKSKFSYKSQQMQSPTFVSTAEVPNEATDSGDPGCVNSASTTSSNDVSASVPQSKDMVSKIKKRMKLNTKMLRSKVGSQKQGKTTRLSASEPNIDMTISMVSKGYFNETSSANDKVTNTNSVKPSAKSKDTHTKLTKVISSETVEQDNPKVSKLKSKKSSKTNLFDGIDSSVNSDNTKVNINNNIIDTSPYPVPKGKNKTNNICASTNLTNISMNNNDEKTENNNNKIVTIPQTPPEPQEPQPQQQQQEPQPQEQEQQLQQYQHHQPTPSKISLTKRTRSRSMKFSSRKRHKVLSSIVEEVIIPRNNFSTPRWSNGWSWQGPSFQYKVFLNSDDPPVTRTCYSAMCHIEGDVIRPRDCVLLRAGNKKAELPYVAKVAYLWENPEDGEMMMSLLWYYRPEHTEQGRQSSDCPEEVFASRHKDNNSVACIEDKCYVLTYNEYCRYRRQLKSNEEHIEEFQSLVPPLENPMRRPIPSNTLPELVMFCQRVYEFRSKRLLKTPN